MLNAPGQLDVLNCGHGHLQIKFDKDSEDDRDKAKRVIRDMLKRGYILFVEIDGEQHRVKDFDPEREEYILKDPADIDTQPEANHGTEQATPSAETKPSKGATKNPPVREPLRDTGKRRRGRAPMRTSRATGIGPTAGG